MAKYKKHWKPGQMLVCDEGTNFIDPGAVVVYQKRTFAPFIKVLIPGIREDAVGHFNESSFRIASTREIHEALSKSMGKPVSRD